VEAGAVGVDVDDAAAEGVHRHQGWGQRCGVTGETFDGGAAELFPQLIGGAEAEVAELVETPGAGLAPGPEGDEQHPDRLHVAIASLGNPSGTT
jgi:hypothetical protein